MNKSLTIFGIFLLLHGPGLLSQETQKMNFLFIAVDDLKPTMGCYGDTLAYTPNIDEIAGRGTTFTRNYCQQAVCAPSRASLMTSRYPDQTRVWDLETLMRDMDPGIVTLPQYLIRQGYTTAATGKIFDPRSVDPGRDTPSWSVPWRHPWDASYYNAETGKPSYFYAGQHAKDTIALLQAEADHLGIDQQSYVQERYFPPFENADVPVDAYVDGVIAKIGIELMEQVSASGDPFFLGIGFHRPHLPFNAPKQFWDLYDPDDFKLASFRGKAVGSPDIAYHNYSELRSYTGIPEIGALPDHTQLELIHAYYASTSYIDHLIGQVMARLKELGLENNTAVILWGDHGWHLGDHQLWCKHSNFEQATRSPLIISFPTHPLPGSVCHSPVEFTDVAPTLCDLAGLEIPAYFEGESLAGLFQEPLGSVREASLSQYPRNGRMGYSLRTERYRYTRWNNQNGSLYASELYDYALDPLETISYINDPAYAGIVAHLDSLVRERIAIPSTQERIEFVVKGAGHLADTLPMDGATVHLEQESRRTDATGHALFTHNNGSIDFQVDAPGYISTTGSLALQGDTLISILLIKENPVYQVNVHLKDTYTDEDLWNVSVKMGETEIMTDNMGWAYFALEEGSYAIKLSKADYSDTTAMIFVPGDTSFFYALKATHADVKFWLKENATPVNQAAVSLSGAEVLSNSLGISNFTSVPTGLWYEYNIAKEGYQPIQDSLYLMTDTALFLQLDPVTGQDMKNREDPLAIWPNPAGSFLNCHVGAGFIHGHFEIYDGLGRLLHEQKLKSPDVTINIEKLLPGMYWLRYITDATIHQALFYKK